MKTPAIILARKGSKGCPDKNKRVLAGHPSWRWSVFDADAAGCRPIVTTDDHDIIEGCCNIGCEVVIRPAELANDTAKVEDAVRHACTAKGIDSGPVVVLYGCVPVRPRWLISSALAVLEATGADSVQSYCPVGKCHPWWMAMVGKDGGVIAFNALADSFVDTPAVPHRRQDLPPLWIPDGGVIVVRDPDKFFGEVRQSVTTRPGDVIDIDTDADLMLAECVLRERIRKPLSYVSENFPETMQALANAESIRGNQ